MNEAQQVIGTGERIVVLATGTAFFMIVLDTSIVNLALPRIRAEFGTSLATLQWLVDGYALVFASLLLSAGALGDRLGARRVFQVGLILFSLASAACGLASGIATLELARIVQGIGAALLLPNSLAALSHSVTEPGRRAAAVSAWAGAGALGIALGPVLGGFFVQTFSWRSIFLVNVPIGLIGFGLAQRYVSAGSRNAGRALDLWGQVFAVAVLASVTFALISIGRSHQFGVSEWALIVLALALGGGFLVAETRQADPMLPLSLLTRPKLGQIALVGLLHNVGIYGLIFVLSLALQQLRGLAPLPAGLLFVPMTLALAIGTQVGGRILNRAGPYGLLIWGHGIATLGASALVLIGIGRGVVAIIPPLIAIGGGAGVTTPAMSLTVLDAVERERSGLASGILNSARQAGGVIGVALLGALLGESVSMAGFRYAAIAAVIAFAGAFWIAIRVASREHIKVQEAALAGR